VTPHWTIVHLAGIRRTKGVRQHAVADELDVWQGVVANWEIGHGVPSTRHVAAIAGFLGWRLVATGGGRLVADGDLAAELKRLRVQAGLTQRQMAAHMGISKAGVAGLEARPQTTRITRTEEFLAGLGYRLGLVPADAPLLQREAP
jgi:transcriptional regulator with XRE-family HTH domain